MIIKPPLVALVGPTASGKSQMAIELAETFRGEIVSADSRQVYRGMDVGTSKVTKAEQARVRHHLLDMTDPTETFTLAEFQAAAFTAIHHIHERGRLPLLIGGTGLYVRSVVDNLQIPPVPPQPKLRAELEKLPLEQLRQRLKGVDPVGYLNIDLHNPRRIIRAIEVSETVGVPFSKMKGSKEPEFDTLMIGITVPPEDLQMRIENRMRMRLAAGFVDEVKHLHDEQGVGYDRLESFGLEYRRLAEYLQDESTLEEAVERSRRDLVDFAKRQITWFKRDRRIKWIDRAEQAEDLITDWLTQRAAHTIPGD